MKISVKQAISLLNQGVPVAIPTETVYGLATLVNNSGMIKKVFQIKGRPSDNPLIVHVATLLQLKTLVKSMPSALTKLKKFWPGPLTVVLNANCSSVSPRVRAGLKTVAVRIPEHQLTLRILKKVGPLAAPSANCSGRPSPTLPEHVENDFGSDFPVVDGGPCRKGVESTVIRLFENGDWMLLRQGPLSSRQISQALQRQPLPCVKEARQLSPGLRHKHYAPQAQLYRCQMKSHLKKIMMKQNASALVSYEDQKNQNSHLKFYSLGKRGSYKDNLRRLYKVLRQLDTDKIKCAVIDCDVPEHELRNTLLDRINRASGDING